MEKMMKRNHAKKEKTGIKKCVTKTTGKKIKPLVDAWHAGV